MSHGKSLRVIGQTLEAARIPIFEVEKRGPHYIVCIASTIKVVEGLLRDNKNAANGVFCFTSADITRLDAQAQKRRRNQSSSATRLSKILSHQLRALGDHLDRIEVSDFHIVWTTDSVILDCQTVDGQWKRRIFTPEELRQLVLHRSLLRSSHYLFPQLDI
jgi:hypothetical protein